MESLLIKHLKLRSYLIQLQQHGIIIIPVAEYRLDLNIDCNKYMVLVIFSHEKHLHVRDKATGKLYVQQMVFSCLQCILMIRFVCDIISRPGSLVNRSSVIEGLKFKSGLVFVTTTNNN